MLVWLAASSWLLLTAIACFKARRKKYLSRPALKQEFFSFGIGWMHFETEALNDLPTGILNFLGVLNYSTDSQPFRNPKTFDDPEDSEPWRARPLGKPSEFSKIKRLILISAYDFGAVLSVVGVFVALGALFHALFCLVGKVYDLRFGFRQYTGTQASHSASHAAFATPHQLTKRATLSKYDGPFSEATSYPHPAGTRTGGNSELREEADAMLLKLVIPGLTSPLSTLPKFLTALVLSQIIHEAGHAFAAALNSVIIHSVGLYILFPLTPVCYVKTLASNSKADAIGQVKLTHVRDLRIATAGVWHNILLASICWLAWNGGSNLFDLTMGRIFWKDISGHGVMVAHVAKESTLRPLLKTRDILTQIDDISLQGNEPLSSTHGVSLSSTRRWNDYLSQDSHPFQGPSKLLEGWCFATAEFQRLSAACCQGFNSDFALGSWSSMCFQSRGSQHVPVIHHCVDQDRITHLERSGRCRADIDCPEHDNCIEPAAGQNLVVLQTLVFGTGGSRTIFYRGSKELLRQEVSVTSMMPRTALISANLIFTIHEMFSFLVSLSLGLAFVNLLPIENFDGLAICEAVTSFISGQLADDPENAHYEIDSYPIGHARPTCAPGLTHQSPNAALVEIQHSILIKVLNCLTSVLRNNPLFGTPLPVNNFRRTSHGHLRTLQKLVTWTSCVVFAGLLILTF
ncbi:hypothetical protein MJO29_016574 [Puccinia striiformis f. sp. tritici]|nr:hypothetical protein MJO29_016574 [Puccinia striiformis f. sp. tritici]